MLSHQEDCECKCCSCDSGLESAISPDYSDQHVSAAVPKSRVKIGQGHVHKAFGQSPVSPQQTTPAMSMCVSWGVGVPSSPGLSPATPSHTGTKRQLHLHPSSTPGFLAGVANGRCQETDGRVRQGSDTFHLTFSLAPLRAPPSSRHHFLPCPLGPELSASGGCLSKPAHTCEQPSIRSLSRTQADASSFLGTRRLTPLRVLVRSGTLTLPDPAVGHLKGILPSSQNAQKL